MKKIITSLLLLLPMIAFAQPIPNSGMQPNKLEGRVLGKKVFYLYKVVAHAAVSDDWKTFITFRNDQERETTLIIDFLDADGAPVEAEFYTIENNEIPLVGTGVDMTLPPVGMDTIEFDFLPGGQRNLQVFVYAEVDGLQFGIETMLHNFQGADKVATVGAIDQLPGPNFFMNIDRRLDPYTQNWKQRGFAVTNVSEFTCDCEVVLYDDLGGFVDSALLRIDSGAKWLGTTAVMFPDIDDLLVSNLGLIDVRCNENVAVLGLAFEDNTPIVGSVPVDYFEIVGGKRVIRAR
ncbi:MAG: hypothetical protein QNK37_08880 [Acidobacteriota bacterium]|nr:hypothetical protein [Acidobacteriota bacterium]